MIWGTNELVTRVELEMHPPTGIPERPCAPETARTHEWPPPAMFTRPLLYPGDIAPTVNEWVAQRTPPAPARYFCASCRMETTAAGDGSCPSCGGVVTPQM